MTIARTPLDLTTAFGHADAATLERTWGASEPEARRADGWHHVTWTQSWFGLDAMRAKYTFDPAGHLVRIDLSARDADVVLEAMRTTLGEPDEMGLSPQVMMSTSYARWSRDGVTFTIENFEPGCEVGILRIPKR